MAIRHKMEFNLLQCIVEPQNDIASRSSSSSDVTLSSSKSDGDAPVVVVSRSRSQILNCSHVVSTLE